MILTDKFVFIHQPKTGGTFVTQILNTLYGAQTTGTPRRIMRGKQPVLTEFRKHGACFHIPAAHRRKPILGVVRNPYDHYVSHYEFGWWKSHPSFFGPAAAEVPKRCPSFPDLSFGDFITLTNSVCVVWENRHFAPEERCGWLTNIFVRHYFRNPREAFANISPTYISTRQYQQDLYPVHFLRTHRLNEDLHQYLLTMGYAPEQLAFILDSPKIYPIEGGRGDDKPWTSYYTPELKRVVRRREQLLFAMFPEFDV